MLFSFRRAWVLSWLKLPVVALRINHLLGVFPVARAALVEAFAEGFLPEGAGSLALAGASNAVFFSSRMGFIVAKTACSSASDQPPFGRLPSSSRGSCRSLCGRIFARRRGVFGFSGGFKCCFLFVAHGFYRG